MKGKMIRDYITKSFPTTIYARRGNKKLKKINKDLAQWS